MNHSDFHCRACGATGVESILSFGRTPLADALLTGEQLGSPELTAPLDLVFCPSCSLVQITETVPPEILFCRSYPYFSSVSKALLAHFAGSAADILVQPKPEFGKPRDRSRFKRWIHAPQLCRERHPGTRNRSSRRPGQQRQEGRRQQHLYLFHQRACE